MYEREIDHFGWSTQSCSHGFGGSLARSFSSIKDSQRYVGITLSIMSVNTDWSRVYDMYR